MASSVWPVGLPQEIFKNSSYTFPNIVQHNKTVIGPGKTRSLASSGTGNMNVPIVLDSVDLDIFNTFFVTTLMNGALPFEWFDPISGDSVDFRFTPGSTPVFNLIVGGTPQMWRGNMQLEILPQ